MRKSLIVLFLICSLALSGSVFADGNDNPPPSVSTAPATWITPMSSIGYASQALIGQQMSYNFDVTSAMPEWRVWINNTSIYSYHVTITKGSPTGPVQWAGDVSANTQMNIWSNYAYAADTYYVNFTCGGGNMSGEVAARIASTHGEILP